MHILTKTLLLIIGSVAIAQADSLLTEQLETPAERTAREVLASPAQTADVLLGQLADATERLFSGDA